MPQTASVDASPTGSPRALRCRRPAGSGHRAVAGELAALAFEPPTASEPPTMPEATADTAQPLPRPRPSAD